MKRGRCGKLSSLRLSKELVDSPNAAMIMFQIYQRHLYSYSKKALGIYNKHDFLDSFARSRNGSGNSSRVSRYKFCSDFKLYRTNMQHCYEIYKVGLYESSMEMTTGT